MKKLKVVLTLLLVLCCSLCMFACGGGEKSISSVELSGQKLNFKEGEAFSLGDIKVTAYYHGDDNAHELKPEDYDVDSSAYNQELAGQYIIYIIPKNQPKELTEGDKDNRYKKSYYVSVDHSWTNSTDPNYQLECKCGAKQNSYTGLEDKITTVGWGTPATFTPGGEGKTYPSAKAPIKGENHVSYGSLVKGQSLKLNIQITGLTRTDNPATASAWDSPLMGIRNAGVGVLPREDGWIIATAAGFALPGTSNIPSGGSAATTGTATTDDNEWVVYSSGTSWSAGSAFPGPDDKWSTVDVEYNYQADGIFMMTHVLHKYDGTESKYIITMKVPEAAYEVVVYGEYCNFTITGAEFVAGRAIESFEVSHDPDNPVQPAGKLFDATGLDTKAVFSDKGELTGSYNAYAYKYVRTVEKEPTGEKDKDDNDILHDVVYYYKTRVNLATEPLQADYFGFFVEFNGKQAWLSTKGEEIKAGDKLTEAEFTAEGFLAGLQAQDKVKVVATPITGANASAIKLNQVAFESPDVAYDYAVTDTKTENFANAYIKLTANGAALKATDRQKAEIDSATHFIAFKLVTNLAEGDFDAVTASDATSVVVKATKVGSTVDVVVGLKDKFGKSFDITLTKGGAAVQKVQIDLNGIKEELTEYGAEIIDSNFYLDIGGTYTVEYTGLGTEAEINALTLPVLAKRDTVADVAKAATGTYTEGTPTDKDSYRASSSLYITKVQIGAGKLTVTYWLGAPELGNLTADACTTTVSLRDGDTTLASANLTYTLAVSENVTKISEGVYVKSNNNKLQVYAFNATDNITSGFSFAAKLNIENEQAASYNVGVVLSGATDAAPVTANWLDLNDLTAHTSSVAKFIALGTVDNNTDYDKGVILVANLHLPALGLREGSANRGQVYHFTANEEPDYPAEQYTIFTVGAEGDNNLIASQTVTASEYELEEDVVKSTCLQDGTNARKFKYNITVETEDGGTTTEEKVFYFGAEAVKATGVHEWTPAEGNDRTCSKCGAHYMKFTDTDGTVHELTDLPTITRVANPDTNDSDWWKSPTADIPVSGDFVVRYSWTNTDGNYPADAAVELHNADGKYFGYRTFAADYNPGNADGSDSLSELHAKDKVITTVFKKNGADVTGIVSEAGVNWKGEAYVTVYRYGTTLVIDAHLTLADAAKTTYQATTTITKFTADDLNLHINGNHYWCDKLMVGIGSATTTTTTATSKTVVSTGDLGMSIGKPDNSTGYTGNAPLWTMEGFKPGMKVEAVGTMTNNKGDVYMSGLAYIDGYVNFRPDNWVNGIVGNTGSGVVEGNTDLTAAPNWLGFFTQNDEGVWESDPDVNGTAWFDVFKPYITSGQTFTQTTIWDWTDESEIVITYYIQGVLNDQPVQWRQAYTLTAVAEKTLAESYTIGLGVDHAYYNVNKLTVTEPVKA